MSISQPSLASGGSRFEAKVQEWKLPLFFTAPATSAEGDHQQRDRPTNAPAPMAMIPAGEPKRGSSCMAAIRMPHTRNPAPVPIPITERIRQTNGFLAPQINNPIKTTATTATIKGEALRTAEKHLLSPLIFC